MVVNITKNLLYLDKFLREEVYSDIDEPDIIFYYSDSYNYEHSPHILIKYKNQKFHKETLIENTPIDELNEWPAPTTEPLSVSFYNIWDADKMLQEIYTQSDAK
jgi:hypothetical protein